MKTKKNIFIKLFLLNILLVGLCINSLAQEDPEEIRLFNMLNTSVVPGKNMVPGPTEGKYGYYYSGDGTLSFKMGEDLDQGGGKVRSFAAGYLTRVTIYNADTNAIIYNSTGYYMEGNRVSVPTHLTRGNYILEVEYEGNIFQGNFSHDH